MNIGSIGKKLLVLAATLVVLGGVAATSVSASKEGPQDKDIKKSQRDAVPNVAPSSQFVDNRVPLPPPGKIGAPGVVEPRDREVKLSTQVPGVVAEVLVHEGDRVKTGDPLIKLHSEAEEAAYAAAQADIAVANAQLTKVLRGSRVEEIQDVQAQSTASHARAEESARELGRVKSLFDTGATTQDALDKASSQAKVDEHNAAAVDARRTAVLNGSRNEDVAVGQAAVAQAQARLVQARTIRDRLTLFAPFSGEVLKVWVRPGEYINPAAGPSVTMGDTSEVRVRLDVDERNVSKIEIGKRGYVQAETWGEKHYEGKVIEIGRRMGKKNVRTDEAGERLDTQVLEVVMELDGKPPLVQGLRVNGFL